MRPMKEGEEAVARLLEAMNELEVLAEAKEIAKAAWDEED